ncbi:MAG: hypothetical protein U0Q10_06455 [Dermatophilaceae bacterium]
MTMDAGAKARVREVLLARAREEVAAAQESVGAEQAAGKLDQDSSFSVDDQSQTDEAGGLAALFEETVARQQTALAELETLDFGPRERVSPGAIIGVDGDRYVVGVVAGALDCDGVTYEGMSIDSPLYAVLAGHRAGDTVAFRGRDHRIDFVA